jgi:transposase-like protein
VELVKPSGLTGRLRYFKTSSVIIRLAVLLYVRFPLSLWNVEDLLHERGVDVSHETVWFWWHRFTAWRVVPILPRHQPDTNGMHS